MSGPYSFAAYGLDNERRNW